MVNQTETNWFEMKKAQKIPIQELFNKDAFLTEKALNSMAAAVSAFCNGKDKDISTNTYKQTIAHVYIYAFLVLSITIE